MVCRKIEPTRGEFQTSSYLLQSGTIYQIVYSIILGLEYLGTTTYANECSFENWVLFFCIPAVQYSNKATFYGHRIWGM